MKRLLLDAIATEFSRGCIEKCKIFECSIKFTYVCTWFLIEKITTLFLSYLTLISFSKLISDLLKNLIHVYKVIFLYL